MRTFTKLALGLVGCTACGNAAAPTSSMPWLRGFTPSATADTETTAASDRMAELVGIVDDAGYGGLQLRADVAPNEGNETVLASYRQGIAVLDRDGHLLARRPGFDATGSSDDLIALATGDAGIGGPVIALAVQRGGHRISEVSILVYRVDNNGRIGQLFEGPIEDHDGDDTVVGALTFLPNALLYRAPRAERASTWTFDAVRGRYAPPRS